MLRKGFSLNLLVALPLVFLFGCSDLGDVDQGRVVRYDKEKRTVTIIRDIKHDPMNPDYSHLPPVSYSLPTDHMETGPEPKAGGRMKLDKDKKVIIIFDPETQNFKTIDIQIVDVKENVDRQDALVFEVRRKEGQGISGGRQREEARDHLFRPPEAFHHLRCVTRFLMSILSK